MTPGALPFTAALASMATVDHDLTPFAMREQAFSEMLANARHGGPAYDAAKARFGNLGSTLRSTNISKGE